ncbi:MAG: peptidase [Geobacteraceae bacterium]|nr:MAG: peptidase [Geobacteraceae bacterium]
MIIVLLLAIFLCAGHEARADIYRYVNEEGVVCFTDTPPHKNAAIIMKEKPKTFRAGEKAKVPRHLSATGIAEKIGTNHPDLTGSTTGGGTTLPLYGKITSLSGVRHDPIDGKLRHHNGVDIATPQETPVKPVAPGKVLFSGARPGYGNTVIIEHSDGTITLYAHNSANLVAEGEYAGRGTTIALSGSTGRSTGPHLHFEAWRDGENITSTFMPGETRNGTQAVAANNADDRIRRIIQTDGTLLFTNLR